MYDKLSKNTNEPDDFLIYFFVLLYRSKSSLVNSYPM